MTETFGWMGKILRVDLSTAKVSLIETSGYQRFIGGVGIAAKIFWDEQSPDIGPFDPENRLIIMTGPLTGTLAPGGGRANMCSMSPQAHPKPNFTYSSMGGNWPAELKFSGYDGLVIQGKAEDPSYVWIKDEEVEIRDATKYWGCNTYDTQKKIMKELGDKEVRTLCIGPAGENLVRFATPISDTASAFGQGGFGFVMGAKKLKAISVRGSGAVNIARPKEFMNVCLEQGKILERVSRPGDLIWGSNCGPQLAEKYGLHADGCVGCIANCKGFFKVPGYPSGEAKCVDYYYGVARDPPLGRNVADEATWHANVLANLLGLNNNELAGMQHWLKDCYNAGIITEEDLPLPDWFGGTSNHHEFLSTWLKKIAHREGIGDLLAEGTARAAEKLGKKAWEFYTTFFMARGYHSHWVNSIVGCLQWALDSRDPFNSGHNILKGLGRPLAAKMAWGSEELADPENYEHAPKALVIIQNRKAYKDMIPLCDWNFPNILTHSYFLSSAATNLGNLDLAPKMFSTATGIETSEQELQRAGERVVNLQRAIMIREGRSREDDSVYPVKFKKKFFHDGMGRMWKGWMFGPLDKEKWERAKDKYYELRGWNVKTGIPTRAKLKELQLQDVADELDRIGLIP